MGGGEERDKPAWSTPRLTPAADALLHTDVPVVAAVNGAAVGWGMELAMMADLRVASERAKFGELFVLRGLCTDVAGIGRLAQLVGREKAAELVFTGDVIDAARAEEIGLVGRVVAHDELLPTALELADEDRRQPAARRAEDQGGPAPGPRPGLDRPRRVGVDVARRAVPDRGPPRGRQVVPGEASCRVRGSMTMDTPFDLDPDRQAADTTRAVRKRLDLTRPVPRELVRECIEVATQAPAGGNVQRWRWVCVDDPDIKAGLADLYRRAYEPYIAMQREMVSRPGAVVSPGSSPAPTTSPRCSRTCRCW